MTRYRSVHPVAPRLARLLAAAALCLLTGVRCGGGGADRGVSLLAEPLAIDPLTESTMLGGPRSDGPNRFFGGWVPATVHGRGGFFAAAGGASFQVVTLAPRERTLTLDLLDDGHLSRLVDVRVRIDRGAATLVPVIDPLAIRLPPDLPPGRHLVEILPRTAGDPPLLVAAARIDPSREGGSARIDGGALVQSGPSIVDLVARPPELRVGRPKGTNRTNRQERAKRAGPRLTGSVCPGTLLGGTGGFALSVIGIGNRVLGRWQGGGALDRLRGCRRFALDLPGTGGGRPDPVRIRLSASDPGRTARWTVRWEGPTAATGAAAEAPTPGTTPTPAPAPATLPAGATFSPPRLVVVYLLDALRADSVSHLGGPDGTTPVIDRLAREGFTFRSHRSNAPNTLPSMRELFTGRIYFNQKAWRRLGADRPTLAEAFQRAGYRTGLFSGNQYVSASYGLARGFDYVSEESLYTPSPGGAVNRNAEQVQRAALAWLDRLPAGQPVFLYLHTIHPHNPYAPPAAFARRFTAGIPSTIRGTTGVLLALQKGRRTATAADRARLKGLYAGSLAYNDAQIGPLLDALGERFAPEDTLVVVTADHGDELFDHGGTLHGYTLYEELLRIPLVVWSPGRVRVGTTEQPTDTLDLHATLLDLARRCGAGPADAGEPASQGRSLLPLLTRRAGAPGGPVRPGEGPGDRLRRGPRFAATWEVPGGIFAVRDGAWKLIEVRGTDRGSWMGLGPGRSRDRRYLFDLAADPKETENLAGLDSVREQWLLARLHAWIAAQQADMEDRADGADGTKTAGEEAEPALDEAARKRLKALGYLN